MYIEISSMPAAIASLSERVYNVSSANIDSLTA